MTASPLTDNRTARKTSPRPAKSADKRRTRSAFLFLSPFALVFLAMMVAPICYSLYQSFFRLQSSGLGLTAPTTVFAGFGNYIKAIQDSDFLMSFVRVFTIGIIQVPVMLILGLFFALLLDSAFAPLRKTFRLIYFLPYALPGVIAAIMWSFLYQPSISPFTQILQIFGLNVNFLSSNLVYFSIGNMMTWGYTGFNMIIIYSALQAIPGELNEAASLDGCGWWRTAWHVKIPSIRSALILTAVFAIIGTAQLYNDPQILSQVAPSVSSTFTPIMAAQQSAAGNNYNYAAAQSIILALVTLVLSFAFLRFTQRKEARS